MRLPKLFPILAALAVVTSASGMSPTSVLAADQLTKDSIVKSLTAPKTRSFNPPSEETVRYRSLVDTLRKRSTRQITVEERTEVAKYVKESDLPAIDMEIYFQYNSASLDQSALPKLNELGQALNDDQLKDSTFMIAGHTDATGPNAYNQSLSERRADTVRGYLIKTFGLDASKLIAIGYGEEQLKMPDAPAADENRRVQVVNLQTN